MHGAAPSSTRSSRGWALAAKAGLRLGEALALGVLVLAGLKASEVAYDGAFAAGDLLSDGDAFLDIFDSTLVWAITLMAPLNGLIVLVMQRRLRPLLRRDPQSTLGDAIALSVPW